MGATSSIAGVGAGVVAVDLDLILSFKLPPGVATGVVRRPELKGPGVGVAEGALEIFVMLLPEVLIFSFVWPNLRVSFAGPSGGVG